jgi:pimeloyl-ACP methyl ester carboxylesterase
VLGPLASQMMHRSLVERSLRQSVANQAVVTPQAVDRYWELARLPGNRAATRERFALPWARFAAADVARIGVPTLVMWGEEDSLVPLAAGRWYARTLPDARMLAYPGIGHLPMEEAPDRSAQDLAAFIDGVAEAPVSPALAAGEAT